MGLYVIERVHGKIIERFGECKKIVAVFQSVKGWEGHTVDQHVKTITISVLVFVPRQQMFAYLASILI